MKVTAVCLTVGLLLLSGFDLVSGRTDAQQGTESRRVVSRKGAPLLWLRHSGDKDVVIEKDATPPMVFEAPHGMSQLEWLGSTADQVLIIHVARITPHLTKTEDWITSEVAGSVLEVVSPDYSSRRVIA